MASEFFGLRGKLVKQYQDILNSLGANLKVNGKWNKKTEAAFNQFREPFLRAIGQPVDDENPYEKREFTPRSEEELKNAARNGYGSLYDDQIEEAQRAAESDVNTVQGELDALEPAYQKQLDALLAQYDKQRQELSDAALSRGLGRSSYVTDQLAGSQVREMTDANALAGNTLAQQRKLQQSITDTRRNAASTQARLMNEREKRVLAAIEEYRAADRKSAEDAQRYNNELDQQYRKEQEEKRQFQLDLANKLRLARMK